MPSSTEIEIEVFDICKCGKLHRIDRTNGNCIGLIGQMDENCIGMIGQMDGNCIRIYGNSDVVPCNFNNLVRSGTVGPRHSAEFRIPTPILRNSEKPTLQPKTQKNLGF